MAGSRVPRAEKPKALHKGSRVAIVSPSSPADQASVIAGIAELERLGFVVDPPALLKPEGYFSANEEVRLQNLAKAMHKTNVEGVIALRGGYGSNYLVDHGLATRLRGPKCLIGFSDLTTVHILMGGIRGWVTFYGPMLTAGFAQGADKPGGYDMVTFLQAVMETEKKGWNISLRGETLVKGEARGRLAGGCLTLVQTSLGTGYEIETDGTILLLEDTQMKPYQVDRALMHLRQAGKLEKVSGIILGEFPGADTMAGSPTVTEVCERILGPLGVPMVYGAPIGHTRRPMLTIPLGVRGRLIGSKEGVLEILEAAVEE